MTSGHETSGAMRLIQVHFCHPIYQFPAETSQRCSVALLSSVLCVASTISGIPPHRHGRRQRGCMRKFMPPGRWLSSPTGQSGWLSPNNAILQRLQGLLLTDYSACHSVALYTRAELHTVGAESNDPSGIDSLSVECSTAVELDKAHINLRAPTSRLIGM
jgi:hypothetical protein